MTGPPLQDLEGGEEKAGVKSKWRTCNYNKKAAGRSWQQKDQKNGNKSEKVKCIAYFFGHILL